MIAQVHLNEYFAIRFWRWDFESVPSNLHYLARVAFFARIFISFINHFAFIDSKYSGGPNSSQKNITAVINNIMLRLYVLPIL